MKTSLPAGKVYPLRNPRYYQLASAAATAERQGAFAEAAQLWHEAMDLAIKTVNITWSASRHEFCLKAVKNGWSGNS